VFPDQDGFPCLVPPGWQSLVVKQERAWRFFEQRLGRDRMPVEEILKLPADEGTRALFDWLRRGLRARGVSRVLEIGAGRGWAARLLAEDGHQVVASDLRRDKDIGLGWAREKRDRSAQWFGCVTAAAEALPFRAESFDCVFCLATLRHIADLERVLVEVGRVLRPGGIFVALQEPYRGMLTTQGQRLQGCANSMLARGWHSRMRADAASQALFKSAGMGSILFEVCRRVSTCLDAMAAAGLNGWVLPAPVALTVGKEEQSNSSSPGSPDWLEPFADVYGLDVTRLRDVLDQAGEEGNQGLLSQMLGHWLHVGNPDGVLIACKGQKTLSLPWSYPDRAPADYRQCEMLLLACARRGFIPVHGLYPPENDPRGSYNWAQTQAGLLVAPGEGLEITVAVPPRPWLGLQQRLEIRIENEVSPRAVFAAVTGKTVCLRVPLRAADRARASLLVRLTAGHDFVPSDQGTNSDSRLLAYQLRGVKSGTIPSECLEAFLRQGERD
jgi:hypothetical protein